MVFLLPRKEMGLSSTPRSWPPPAPLISGRRTGAGGKDGTLLLFNAVCFRDLPLEEGNIDRKTSQDLTAVGVEWTGAAGPAEDCLATTRLMAGAIC